MSKYPPPEGPPPPYDQPYYPPPPPEGPPPPYDQPYYPPPGGYAYVPAPIIMPMPVYPHAPPASAPPEPPTNTYQTNYIYQPSGQVDVVKTADASMIDWLPTNPSTARNLGDRAVIGGHEGVDRSPLWVIRARYGGDCIPGKYADKYNTAYIPFAGKEITVYDFDVMVAAPHLVRWLSGSHGSVPPGAIPAGNTESGEPLYIGRARHAGYQHPGKVHASHGCCYIPYGGNEISYKNYEVLCSVMSLFNFDNHEKSRYFNLLTYF